MRGGARQFNVKNVMDCKKTISSALYLQPAASTEKERERYFQSILLSGDARNRSTNR